MHKNILLLILTIVGLKNITAMELRSGRRLQEPLQRCYLQCSFPLAKLSHMTTFAKYASQIHSKKIIVGGDESGQNCPGIFVEIVRESKDAFVKDSGFVQVQEFDSEESYENAQTALLRYYANKY